MTPRLERRIACEGQLSLPAVPTMLDDYAARCEQLFSALGRKLSHDELAHLKKILQEQLNEAFARSQRSSITISYSASVGGLLNYRVSTQHASIEQTYESWVNTRKPPYFGVEPDAKVLAVASSMGAPTHGHVLDIGAGTGRNALALARLGHPVDAVELTPKFAELLEATTLEESLNVRVICKDVFTAKNELRSHYKFMLLSEVVSDFRSVKQLRDLMELAAQCLEKDGQLLINVFLTQANYSADDAAREFGQQVYSCFFSPDELNSATHGLPLLLTSNESVYEFEMTHLPQSAWPPTPWYPEWVSGLDVFDVQREDCPIELRWLVFRKTV